VQKFKKLIRNKKGFTLVELIVVIVILTAITTSAVPGFLRGIRSAKFDKTISSIVVLLEKARTQALASRLDTGDKKIPSGGYGVFFDSNTNAQKAILFVDDWNESANATVQVDYADEAIASRVMPDGIYTAGGDTELETVVINDPDYIRLDAITGAKLADASTWAHSSGNKATVIFKPPFADTTIMGENGSMSINLQNFEAVFLLVPDNIYRKIKFNRITTTPQVVK
jgi:type IV pilus assembly protein PilA